MMASLGQQKTPDTAYRKNTGTLHRTPWILSNLQVFHQAWLRFFPAPTFAPLHHPQGQVCSTEQANRIQIRPNAMLRECKMLDVCLLKIV